MFWIKSVAVQLRLDTRPQFVGGCKAGGGRAPGQWRPPRARARSAGDQLKKDDIIGL